MAKSLLDHGFCSCGIYMLTDKRAAFKQAMGEGVYVIAEVVGWGDVIEADDGCRVEYCRIEGMWVTVELGGLERILQKHYGVPCVNLWDALGNVPLEIENFTTEH